MRKKFTRKAVVVVGTSTSKSATTSTTLGTAPHALDFLLNNFHCGGRYVYCHCVKISGMAASVNRLSCFALRYPFRIPLQRKHHAYTATFRHLHTTSTLRKDSLEDDREDARKDAIQDAPEKFFFNVSSLSPADRNMYDHLSPEEKKEYEEDSRKFHEHMNSPAVISELTAEASTAAFEVSQEIAPEDYKFPKIKGGFMAMGEEDEQGTGEDDDFQGDDITSLGHGELAQHREMREYARIAAWEMPLLSSMLMGPCTLHKRRTS